MDIKIEKSDEISALLNIYKMNCFSLSYSMDDTEVEDEIELRLKQIENRILELSNR